MTTLRQNFIRELVIRGIASRTQESYVAAVHGLAKHYHQPPDQLTDEQLKDYIFYLAKEKELAPATLNLTVYALRSFYQLVLQRSVEQLRLCLPPVKQAVHRPQVFSVEEMEKLLTVGCVHPKHRAFLMTVYGAGLRLNEACHLKPAHIDSARMLLRVEEGKGRKDRYTLLSPRLLQELRSYWLSVRPGPWLFFGRERQLPLPEGTGQGIFNHAVERAGLPKKGGIHSLRHSFATHLLESGVEITVVQKLLGHSSLSSTVTYLHVRRERVAQVQSPLQLLDLDGARNKALAAQP
jgi:site-specific recombinase XerD